jgi:hypothetical protein
MIAEITVNNNEEFQILINNKDFRISKAIVEGILKNINTKKKNIKVLMIKCLEEQEIIDITLDRKDFLNTLEKNIVHYIAEEKYEECQIITSAINNLKSKNQIVHS